MSSDLSNLLRYLRDAPEKSKLVEATIQKLSAIKAEHGDNPDQYELNKLVGFFLAANVNTRHHSENFLIHAVNENRDDQDRPHLLATLADVFESHGDIEREHQLLNEACRHFAHLLPDLALSALRLGDEETGSYLFNGLIDIAYENAVQKAEELDNEVTQLIWPNRVICSRFGELAHRLDVYIKMRKLGLTPKIKAILPTRTEWISNRVLLQYWRDQHPDEITILTDPAAAKNAEQTYDGCEVSTNYFRLPDGRALHTCWGTNVIWQLWEEKGLDPLLKLRDDHRQIGSDWLYSRGMPRDAWFVTLHVREAGYHSDRHAGWVVNIHRDSQIEDYFPAVEAITKQGGWVVRIGDPSMTPLPPMDQVIDYAVATERAEELDIFFCAAAKFMFAATSGPLAVANVFGTPVLAVNQFPPGSVPYSERDLFIHKRLNHRPTGKFLNAHEMVEPPLRLMLSPRYYEEHDINVVDNTPEELREAVEEMMQRMEGRFEMTEQDQGDLNRYREMNDPSGIPTQSMPATSFLRRHHHLVK